MTASGKFKKNDAGDIFINKKGQPKRPPKFLLDIISPFFISD